MIVNYGCVIMADINELAEKKLKSRMTKIRKCNRESEEKVKFSEKLGVSFDVEFHNKNPDKLADRVLLAEYYYEIPETQEYTSIPIDEKKLKSILEFFDDYKLELDDSD